MSIFSGITSNLIASIQQPAMLAVGAGLLAGVVTGTAAVASGAFPIARTSGLALLSCPDSGAVVARAPARGAVLVTAGSSDRTWLQVYVGEPGVRFAWAPASAVRLSGPADGLPVEDCGPVGTASPASPTAAASAEAPTSQTTPAPIDACLVLDHAQAEQLARTPLDPALSGPRPSWSCVYPGPVTGPVAQVEIYIGDTAKANYDTDLAQGHLFRTVPGVGDEAHLGDDIIYFRKGATWALIRLVRSNDPRANDQPLIVAATAVVAAMP